MTVRHEIAWLSLLIGSVVVVTRRTDRPPRAGLPRMRRGGSRI